MNKAFWNLYKESERGKKAIAIFNPDNKQPDDWFKEVFSVGQDYYNGQSVDLLTHLEFLLEANCSIDGLDNENMAVDELLLNCRICELKADKNGQYIMNEEGRFELDENPRAVVIDKNDYRKKAANIHIISTYLFNLSPVFIPLLYKSRFDIFRENCELLGIELPEIPRTKDYAEFLLYYLDICDAVEQFRTANVLTPEEMCACIYFYAQMEMGENEKKDNLPKPTNIWLTGASNEDYKMIERDGCVDGMSWACNEKTCRGDIVVVYAVSPNSCIHSIWRAETGGRFNPFDDFHCRTTVVNCAKLFKLTPCNYHIDPLFLRY